jgi:hypothetical protein
MIVATVAALIVGLSGPAAASGIAADDQYVDWRNILSGKCLDQSWADGVQHPEVLAISCRDVQNQFWALRVVGDHVKLINLRSGKCLDQSWSGGVEHREVLAITCRDVRNQDWYRFIFTDPDGRYSHSRFQNVRSGKFLTQDYTGGVEHREVIAYPYVRDAQNQTWF